MERSSRQTAANAARQGVVRRALLASMLEVKIGADTLAEWVVGMSAAGGDRPPKVSRLDIITTYALCARSYVRRGFRSVWFDGRFIEGGFRLAFCASVAAVAVQFVGFLL